MTFSNLEIDIEALPKTEEVEYQQLSPAYPKVSYIGNLIFFAVLLGGLFGTINFSEAGNYIIFRYVAFTCWFLWFVLAMWLVHRAYEIQGYALREKDIIHRKGVVFRRTTVIPFNRVQHCEVKQGPIERMFDLHTIEIYTAGGQSSDLRIPGLQGELAQQLKEFIIKRTGQHDPK